MRNLYLNLVTTTKHGKKYITKKYEIIRSNSHTNRVAIIEVIFAAPSVDIITMKFSPLN